MREVVPFGDERLGAAGALLAARHRAHRRGEPLLSAIYEDPAATRAEVEAPWAKDGAAGAVAVDAGGPVGYLLGTRLCDVWGANAWVESAGHAVEQPETIRDLYAAAATR